MKKIGQFCR